MEFLPQPHGATCTERQSCATARGRGREIYLAGAPWRNARAEQALRHDSLGRRGDMDKGVGGNSTARQQSKTKQEPRPTARGEQQASPKTK